MCNLFFIIQWLSSTIIFGHSFCVFVFYSLYKLCSLAAFQLTRVGGQLLSFDCCLTSCGDDDSGGGGGGSGGGCGGVVTCSRRIYEPVRGNVLNMFGKQNTRKWKCPKNKCEYIFSATSYAPGIFQRIYTVSVSRFAS